MDDREIVALFLKRDETAIRESKQKYGAWLRSLALRFVHDERTAQECEADAYLDAWNSIPPNEPYGYFRAYLSRLARCRAIDRLSHDTALKRRAEHVELTRELEGMIPSRDDVPAEAEANELARLINAYLSGLPKQKRDVFVLRYWFMDTVPEIARRTGSSESRIKMMLLRMRRELEVFLREEGYLPRA